MLQSFSTARLLGQMSTRGGANWVGRRWEALNASVVEQFLRGWMGGQEMRISSGTLQFISGKRRIRKFGHRASMRSQANVGRPVDLLVKV